MSSQDSPLSLGTDSLSRLLFRYALPAIIAQVAASLYNIIDSIFIGQGVGPLAISGLALTMPMMNLTAAFGAMIGAGSAAITSIRLGQGNKPAAERILGNVVLLNVLLGVVLWRMLSRNVRRRARENRRYLTTLERLRDREHCYFVCPKCHQDVRVPKDQGKIAITCPQCRERFIKKT